jgi:hypothetical protein
MQSKAKLGYQLSICSTTIENHGKPWSSWLIAKLSEYKLSSNQHSGNLRRSHNISCYLYCSFFLIHEKFSYKVSLNDKRTISDDMCKDRVHIHGDF